MVGFLVFKRKKEHQCHVCHHEFSTQSNLNVHMRKHTG